ncbi:MAG: molybdopterin molybdenumtransferase MoeA [Gammaproteobacteria bacterium]|nr:MAG: molybdopterin molybdenumtransferase MoeA [Gammaproteobacteria bacterium]
MISYAAALDILASAATPLPAANLPCNPAAGLTAAADLASSVAVPPFANAAMDGFALRSIDTQGASAEAPLRLAVAGSIPAGSAAPAATAAGLAWEIMTGAPLPEGCDAVVAVERAEVQRDTAGRPQALLLREPLAAGRNRRDAGEDFRPGGRLLAAGRAIDAPAIMGLAATGTTTLLARPAPRVAVIATGSELSGAPTLGAGLIRDSNRPYLAAMLTQLQLPLTGSTAVADEPAAFTQALAAALDGADLVITTGGVSAGRLDFVPAAITAMGGETLFHKVAIRPGKPLLAARFGRRLVLALPGNPMAVAVGLRFFVLPALRALAGRAPEPRLRARALDAIHSRKGLTFFAKARAHVDAQASLCVSALPGQESFRIAPLLAANCWAILDAERGGVAAGELLDVAPLLPGEFPAGAH